MTDVQNGGRISSVVYVPGCSRFQDPTFMLNYDMWISRIRAGEVNIYGIKFRLFLLKRFALTLDV